ncbi:acyltransferase [Streptomyces sp. NPDC001770]
MAAPVTVHQLSADGGRRVSVRAAGRTQISRKQAGSAAWSLTDVDRLSAHYGIPVPDLLAGVDRAVHCLPVRRRAPAPGAAQLTISP